MKDNFNILIVIFCFIAINIANSQTYQVAVSQRTYEDLVGGQSLVKGTWDELEFSIPLGFSFALFNDTIETIHSAEFFAGGYVTSSLDFSSTNLIIAFSSDLIDRGYHLDTVLSPVTYKIEGDPGNKIFTLEFKNAGFWNGETENNIYTDFINYQMKIYEVSGDIEVHLGPHSVLNPGLDFEGFAGPNIGLVEDFNFDNGEINGEIFMIGGDPLDPDLITNFEPASLIWPIPENTVYRFYRPTSSVGQSVSLKYVNFYSPNPTSENISIPVYLADQIIGPVKVINSMGIVMLEDTSPFVIEMDKFPAGIYQLYFMTQVGVAIQRILRVGR